MERFADEIPKKRLLFIGAVLLGLIFYFYLKLETEAIYGYIPIIIGVIIGGSILLWMMNRKVVITNEGIVKIPGFNRGMIPTPINTYSFAGKNGTLVYTFPKTNISKKYFINYSEREHLVGLRKKVMGPFNIGFKRLNNLDYLRTAHMTSKEVVCIEFKEPLKFHRVGINIGIFNNSPPDIDKIYVSVKDQERLLMALN